MSILVIGRTASGKDYFTERLADTGLRVVKSYTTRSKRTPDEDSHIFITPEEAATYDNKVATTVIKGHEYFATSDQVDASDIYIIDPNGFYELTKNMPDTAFFIVYVSAYEDSIRRERFIARAADKEKAKTDFDARNSDENGQFTEFEKNLELFQNEEDGYTASGFPENVVGVLNYVNDFNPATAEENLQTILCYKHRFDRATELVEHAVNEQLISVDDKGQILAAAQSEDCDDAVPVCISKDLYTAFLLSSYDELGKFVTSMWDKKAMMEYPIHI